jgi:hypothetical protein
MHQSTTLKSVTWTGRLQADLHEANDISLVRTIQHTNSDNGKLNSHSVEKHMHEAYLLGGY